MGSRRVCPEAPSSRKKSCDYCASVRKRCDGDAGARRCSRCVARGIAARCVYSERRKRTSYKDVDDDDKSTETSQESNDAICAEQFTVMKLTRCAMSASPATGLVGKEENVFLNDFFGCLGFLPLTSQSVIRDAMVNIMSAFNTRSFRATSRTHAGERETAHNSYSTNSIDRASNQAPVASVPTIPESPAICMFWSAVAIGAILQGGPIHSAIRYIRLAEEALTYFWNRPTPDAARATTILAFVYNLCGDMERFGVYKQYAGQILIRCYEERSAEDISADAIELVQYAEFLDAFDRGDTLSFMGDKVPPPSGVRNLVSEGEICRFLLRHQRHNVQAFVVEFFADTEPAEALLDKKHPQVVAIDDRDTSLSDRRVNAMAALGERAVGQHISGKTAKEDVIDTTTDFEKLARVADRPHIKGGVGAIMINTHLVYMKLMQKDVLGAWESMSRCVETFVRYPGLFRSTLGLHFGHINFGTMAAMGTTDMYSRLNSAFQQICPDGMPPVDEWHKDAKICDNIICRSMIMGKGVYVTRDGEGVMVDEASGTIQGEQKNGRDCCRGHDNHGLLPFGSGVGDVTYTEESIFEIDWLDTTHALLPNGVAHC